jgi:hypothetical protein
MQFGSRNDLKNKLAGKERFEKEDCPFCRYIKNNERILWK